MLYRVDIDGTICTTFGTDYEHAVCLPDAIRVINDLYNEGHTIIYWTSRGVGSGKDYYDLTVKQLTAWGCRYHRLECNKPTFDVLYDDKAHNKISIQHDLPRIVILIPARGGSKSLPRKNIRPYGGEPLVCHTIRYALAFSPDVYVSTDDVSIADVARQSGAKIIERPMEYATDDSDDLVVFQHACSALGLHRDDILIHLRPTSPDRPIGLIEQALELLRQDSRISCVRTVSLCDHKEALKSYTLCKDGVRLKPLCDHIDEVREPFNKPRQTLPSVYTSNGYVDVMYVKTILEQHSMTGSFPAALITPRCGSDIDVLSDWKTSENQETAPSVILGSQPVGLDYSVFVIAEIGINHNGCVDEAKYLMREAAAVGVQCVKLQKRDMDSLFTQRALDKPYQNKHSYGSTYGEHKTYLEFGMTEYLELKKYADSLGVLCTASVWDQASVDFL